MLFGLDQGLEPGQWGALKVGDMNCIIVLKNQNIHRKPIENTVIHMELKLLRKLVLQR